MVYLLFFLTGAAGLIYEMSWSRQIGIFFGHTVNAAAVVLAAYFGGMALGYALAARWSARIRRPLQGYAFCELAVAAWALLTPLVLGLFKLAPVAALLNSEHEALQTAARVIAALLVLLPATIALGATLPFVAQHLATVAGGAGAQQRAIRAYALNTAGAVLGVLLATFVLILQLGVAGSSYLAAGISAFCGLAALVLASGSIPGVHFALPAAPRQPALTPREKQQGVIWLSLAALSGFGTLALQVLYVRLFSMTFNNSTYTFGGIVAVFLLCLALGSWLAARLGRRWQPERAVAWACLLSALLIPLSVLLFRAITRLGYFDYGNGFLAYIGAALLLIAAVIGLPVVVLALVLPLCWDAALVASGERLGVVVGRLTAVNTIAATAGSLLASFLLIPLLGIWYSFAALAGLYYLGALAMFIHWDGLPARMSWSRVLLILMPFALAGLCYSLDPRLEATAQAKGQRYLFLKDTPYGRIDVLENLKTGNRRIRQNRHYNLGGSHADSTERFQGQLPLLLHPDPQRVCFLGLATGITASSAVADERVRDITAVELIPAVVEAAEYFTDHNLGILSDPRSRILVNDARYHLYATRERYDVIASDLFVPWHSQTGYLYTVEHYQAARERLAPGGIFCQWLPVYQLGPGELEMIADSFASVFPCTSLWRGEIWETSFGTLALIGSAEPLQVDLAELRQRAALLREPAASDGMVKALVADPARAYLGDWAAPTGPAAARPLNTDEHPRVEFLAPLAHGDDRLLKGKLWSEYIDSRLAELPRRQVRFLRPLGLQPDGP